MPETGQNPAEVAAAATLCRLRECIDRGESFRLEAGAGAGKTYSLVAALRHLIASRGRVLRQRHQQIACITYTNVACDEIKDRTDGNPVVLASTIHAFFWPLIQPFQAALRTLVPALPKWEERLDEIGGIGARRIEYDLGYPRAKKDEDHISLAHDDVVSLAAQLLGYGKFLDLFESRFPILLVDEYQDTDARLAEAIKQNVLEKKRKLLVGLFGDHWQKIYGDGCGSIEHANLVPIDKGANFRSVKTIVEVLNRMRPELQQQVRDASSVGTVDVFQTNDWSGARRTGQHWGGDLQEGEARAALAMTREVLTERGWSWSPDKTKVLVLTHRVLAREQDYSGIVEAFQGRNDQFVKKENAHIAFFVDAIEPACTAFEEARYGEMFAALSLSEPMVTAHAEKATWAAEMNALVDARKNGTIGSVIDLIRQSRKLRLPEAVERREREREAVATQPGVDEDVVARAERLTKLRGVQYREVIALDQFIDGHTPFSTKHGVKGAEFENVLVVCGRGWNHYDFSQMLELAGAAVPAAKQEFYERNRNLFYVACSRPITRLALLFTQTVSPNAMVTLKKWFGPAAIQPLPRPART